MRNKIKFLLSLAGLLLFLAVWEILVTKIWTDPLHIPPPSALPAVFLKEIQSGMWWSMLQFSLHHYILGILSGTLLGIMAGIWAALSTHFRAGQEWTMRLLRPIPPIAWIPFAIIWFGVTTQAASFIIALGVFWLNYFATISAVSAVNKDYIELADAYGHKTFIARLTKIILPAAAPGILGGVRAGIGQGWMLVVAAELFGIQGIGQRMMEAAGLLATDVVIVYMFTIAAVYSLTDWLYMRIENSILRWQREDIS